MAIEAIHEHAGERRQQQRRYLSAETDDAEEECGSGNPVDEPARRDARDPRPDERYRLPAEEETVVTVSESAEKTWALLVGHCRICWQRGLDPSGKNQTTAAAHRHPGR